MSGSRCRIDQVARTGASLADGTQASMLHGARAALESNDALVAAHVAELRASSRLACASGCAHCCHVDVSASFPEIANLASFIEATFTDEAIAALKERLDVQCASDRTLGPWRRSTSSRRCSLLVDDACSAYEARPLACRGWNSADVAPCIVAFENPGSPPSIPVHRRIRDTALDVAGGIRDGAREHGLDDSPLDLPVALRALLAEGDDLISRWLAGRRLPPELASVPGPARVQDAAGLWRLEDARDE